MSLIDKQGLKKLLVEECRLLHEASISGFIEAMDDAQQSADDYGQTFDLTDAYRTQMLAKRDMFAKQLEKALTERLVLLRLDPNRSSDRVEFGSVVITDSQRLFICVGMGKIHIEGDEYFTISTGVPFYQAMEGRRKGDKVEFRGRTVEIRDVF
jgi:transcription elongation GreA/GreB family factor